MIMGEIKKQKTKTNRRELPSRVFDSCCYVKCFNLIGLEPYSESFNLFRIFLLSSRFPLRQISKAAADDDYDDDDDDVDDDDDHEERGEGFVMIGFSSCHVKVARHIMLMMVMMMKKMLMMVPNFQSV